MDSESAILLKTFGNMTDADIAASHLRSRGVECVVKTDDCGGMYPQMGVIQLFVDVAAADNARRILCELPSAPEADIEEPVPLAPIGTPAPKVYRFNSGLLAGIIVGALAHFGYTRLWQLRDITTRYDFDRDGVPDLEEHWKRGNLSETRFDRNGDGRVDDWSYFREGILYEEQSDDSFDGKADASYTFSKRRLYASGQFDTDFNGVPDAFTTYENGIAKQVDWKPNGTNVVLLRQLFRRGVLAEEFRDVNGDGQIDVRVEFGPFAMPMRTNALSAEAR